MPESLNTEVINTDITHSWVEIEARYISVRRLALESNLAVDHDSGNGPDSVLLSFEADLAADVMFNHLTAATRYCLPDCSNRLGAERAACREYLDPSFP